MQSNNNDAVLTEMKSLVSKFNKGVKKVTLEQGIFCFYVGGRTVAAVKKSAIGMMSDMRMCGGFSSIKCVNNGAEGGVIIYCVPK